MPGPGTPAPEGQDTRARASIDPIKSDSIVDRLIAADPKKADQEEIRQLRNEVHGYQRKFGRDANAHGPDDKLLAIAPLGRLQRMLMSMREDRTEPGDRYGWYVTVAMQRIHGVDPKLLRKQRQELRIAATRGKTLSGEQQRLSIAEQERQHSDGTPHEDADTGELLRKIQEKAQRSKF